MNSYRIVTDAITTKITARDADEAAQKFAQSESIYRKFCSDNNASILCVADLVWAAEKMGGTVDVIEE